MKKERILEIAKAILVVVLFYASSYLQYLAVFLFRMDLNHITMADKVIASTFSNIILVLLLFLIYRKELIREFKKFKTNFRECFDTGLKYWFIGLIIMMASNVLIARFTPLQNSANETSVQMMIGASPLLMFITAGILAPIIEEITFRKAFRGIFKNKWVFCFISGFIFGLLHVIGNAATPYEYLYIIPYGSLGFFFAYSYEKTDTVFTSMMMHAIHNSVLILLSIL